MKNLPTWVAMVLAAGCGGARVAGVHEKGYAVSGQDPFRFDVSASLLREWGGYGSPKFNQVLEQELERLRICRNGYVLRNEATREDVFSVIGRCRS